MDLWITQATKIYEYLFSFVQIRGMSWTEFWKTHPIVNFRIWGHDTIRFLENSSKTEQSKNNILQKLILLVIEVLIKFWMCFPEIGPRHTLEN